MKDNINIEKLFKDKLENFEAEVSPKIWAGVAKGISTSAAVNTGIGFGLKALIISASAVAVGVTVYFVGGFNTNQSILTNNNKVLIKKVKNQIPTKFDETVVKENIAKTVIIAQDNDPVISKNKKEIIKQLTKPKTEATTTNTNPNIINTEVNSNSIKSNETVDDQLKTTDIENVGSNDDNSVTNTESILVETENKKDIIPQGKIEIIQQSNKYTYAFNSNSLNAQTVEWNFGDGEFSKKTNTSHTFKTTGKFNVSLIVVSKDGHVYQETRVIEIKTNASIDNIPNVITPNGDRINDEFMIKTTNIDEFTIQINDSYGNKVFESNDKNFVWDGRNFNGDIVEKAIYTYYIYAKGNDGTVLKIPGQIYVR